MENPWSEMGGVEIPRVKVSHVSLNLAQVNKYIFLNFYCLKITRDGFETRNDLFTFELQNFWLSFDILSIRVRVSEETSDLALSSQQQSVPPGFVGGYV